MSKLKIAYINTPQHIRIVSRYITRQALYNATSVSLKKAGLFTRVFSAGICDGLKEVGFDMQVFRKSKNSVMVEVETKLKEISQQGKKCLPSYGNYIQTLHLKTINLEREMERIRTEVSSYNQNQSDWASIFGKVYSIAKASADTAIHVLSTKTGGAGIAVSYLYGVATDTVSFLSDAENADIWDFSNSLTAPYVMAWNYSTDASTNSKIKLIRKQTAFLPYVLIGNELYQNLKKLD